MSVREIPVRTLADVPTTLAELAGDGAVVARFRPRTTPGDPSVISAIEKVL